MRSTARFLVAALVAIAGAACGGEGGTEPAAAQRVLIVSLPGVGWEDVERGELPSLQAFAGEAGIGHLSTRIGRDQTDDVSAYLTVGAGTRAVSPARFRPAGGYEVEDAEPVIATVAIDASVAVEANEIYRGVPAAEILERRFGTTPEGIVYLAAGPAREANEASAFGAELGALGDELDSSGIRRAVVANADQGGGSPQDPPVDRAYDRAAAAALMGSDGVVPDGRVSRGLLADDLNAAFGRRLDPGVVVEAFEAAWAPRGADDRAVVLVEASDLTRTAAYAERVTASQALAMREAALAAADDLLADLLTRVDLERDAVLVLSPVAPPSGPALGIAALHAPGAESGLLRSATTRRDGYVQLADVAPTVLELVGETMSDEVEGRAFHVSPADGDRIGGLADAADVADFRDRMVAPVVVTLTAVLVLLGLATLFHRRLSPRVRALVPVLALGALGAVAATFLLGAAGAMAASTIVYAVLIVAGAAAVAVAAVAAERRRSGAGLVVALATLILVIAGGVVVGAPLQVNTIFGYSVAVAGRFAGLGNLAFALLGSATVILAAVLADRFGSLGVRIAVAVLGVVVLIEGLPFLGADAGGVLSMVPAFGVTGLVLLGRRVGWKELAVLAAVAGATVLAFSFVDLARPPESRTHLARLADQLLAWRWSPFFDTLGRRGQASFGGTEGAAWAAIAVAAAGVALYVMLVATRRIGPRAPGRAFHRPTVAAAAGLAVLAVLGLVTNDSSFAVPATMLIVVVPVLIHRASVQGAGW